MRNPKLLAAAGMTAALAIGAVAGAALGNPLASGASTRTETPTTTAPPSGKPGGGMPGGGMPGGGMPGGGMPGGGMPGGGMPGGGMPGGGMPGGDKGPGGHGPTGFGAELDAAAKALHLTTDQLQAELRKGKSLAEIAKAQGVPKQDLIDALVKAGEARLDEAKAQLPDVVAKIVDAKPPAGGKGKGDGPMGRGPMGHRGMGFDAAAKALGMSTQDLWAAVRDGKTLAQVAKDKGVDPQKVIDALVADAKAHLDRAVADGHLTKDQAAKQLDRITKGITAMVNDGFKGPMPHHD